eukprot:c25501_g1_i1.p1 GENE.c25501_g1_i1~~c25501_g1_i1.p1  ORF type:complete len:378 (-),score=60.47 c25501_g1_i1:17-1114(-)
MGLGFTGWLLIVLVASGEAHSIRSSTNHYRQLKERVDNVLLQVEHQTTALPFDVSGDMTTMVVALMVIFALIMKGRQGTASVPDDSSCGSGGCQCTKGRYLGSGGQCRACASTVVLAGFDDQNEPLWSACTVAEGQSPASVPDAVQPRIGESNLPLHHSHQESTTRVPVQVDLGSKHPNVDGVHNDGEDEFGAAFVTTRPSAPVKGADKKKEGGVTGVFDLMLLELDSSLSTPFGRGHKSGSDVGYGHINHCYSPQPAFCSFPPVEVTDPAHFDSQVVVLPQTLEPMFVITLLQANTATKGWAIGDMKFIKTDAVTVPAAAPRDVLNRVAAVGDDWMVVFLPNSLAKAFKIEGTAWKFASWLMLK